MTIIVKRCTKARDAIDYLRGLALDTSGEFFFRGHSDESWDLASTYSRHRAPPTAHTVADLDQFLFEFYNLLVTTGKELPFPQNDLRGRLEYARHYGLPTPILDWSFSPYVALFFAFNGTRSLPATTRMSVVYALNISNLADLWIKYRGKHKGGYADPFHKFRSDPEFFHSEYPAGELQFIDGPASWNVRMRRQMGSFLYDTVDWHAQGFTGLEDFIDRGGETTGVGTFGDATLHKVYIPHVAADEVFPELELSGITGSHLYDDYSGAVADVVNRHNYNPKTPTFWNMLAPTPTSTS